jgi:hypothetical protein
MTLLLLIIYGLYALLVRASNDKANRNACGSGHGLTEALSQDMAGRADEKPRNPSIMTVGVSGEIRTGHFQTQVGSVIV